MKFRVMYIQAIQIFFFSYQKNTRITTQDNGCKKKTNTKPPPLKKKTGILPQRFDQQILKKHIKYCKMIYEL